MHYRKDISGLRAVAVVLVLLFHGGIAAFPSGFIGVDVFFVISGFLITSIIQRQLLQGRFSISDFYVRRLWRIQVALLTVVAVTLLLALAFYLPQDFRAYLRSAMDAVGFIANQYFAHATTAYGADDSKVLLLLHTWSLSVEWQWYFFLPLGLMLLHRLCPLRLARWVVLLLAVLAFGMAVWLVRHEGAGAYYDFITRMFEFLTGAIVALFMLDRPAVHGALPSNLLGVIALLVIVVVAMRKGVISDYPNVYALLVCLASAGVIVIAADQQSWVARLLSWRVAEFLGEISYSLYLWHWPIFALARYLGAPDGIALTGAAYLLTLLSAYLSYRFIEEPYRHRRPGLVRSLLWLVLVPLLVLAIVQGVARRSQFLPQRFGSEMVRMQDTMQRYTPPNRQRCMQSSAARPASLDDCTLGDAQGTQTALLIGDSYANQSWNFIHVLASDAGLKVQTITTPSCLALPGVRMQGWWKMTSAQYQTCVDHVLADDARVQAGHYRYVILGQNWLYYEPWAVVNSVEQGHSVEVGRARIEAALRQWLDSVQVTGAIPVLIESPAPAPADYPVCFYQHLKLRRPMRPGVCAAQPQSDAQARWLTSLFARMQVAYPHLILIDPQRVQCDGKRCDGQVDDMPVYRDAGHLTDYASFRFGQWYLQRVGNPFKPADR